MISRETAQRHAAASGYEDYRDWAADNDNAICSQCGGVGSHDEMRFNLADPKDSSLFCDGCWDEAINVRFHEFIAAHSE